MNRLHDVKLKLTCWVTLGSHGASLGLLFLTVEQRGTSQSDRSVDSPRKTVTQALTSHSSSMVDLEGP